jgi:hypothetical protein
VRKKEESVRPDRFEVDEKRFDWQRPDEKRLDTIRRRIADIQTAVSILCVTIDPIMRPSDDLTPRLPRLDRPSTLESIAFDLEAIHVDLVRLYMQADL